MKKYVKEKVINGRFKLTVKSSDKTLWKFMMLLEAASSDESIDEIAKKYGYTREYFYQIKKAYEEGGSQALSDKPKGPKRNYKRTEEIEKQIVRHRFLDPEANSEVITQKMKQAGYNISQRSVERTINKFGLQKKGYIKYLRQGKKKALKSLNKKPKE